MSFKQNFHRQATRYADLSHAWIFFFWLLASACSPTSSHQAQSPSALWTESIGLLEAGSRSCTGILIEPSHVLTAAHCLYRHGQAISPNDFIFIVGRDSGNEREIKVSRIDRLGAAILQPVLAPKDIPNDWAILQLSDSVESVVPLKPSPLTAQQIIQKLSAGSRLFSAGYGSGQNAHLQEHEHCRFMQVGDMVTTDCLIAEGDSGGPIALIDPDGAVNLLAIISSQGKDPKRGVPIAAGVVLTGLAF